MPEETFLFFDFDDTLSESRTFFMQYVRALAQLLGEEFGGESETWAAVAQPALITSKERYETAFASNPLGGFNVWLEEERVRVTEAIFAEMGRPFPLREPLDEFARRIQFDALTACNALLPGTEEALRELFEAGVRMQMASSQESEYLLAALMGGGVESYIESKFGPDLIDCAKEGPEFFRRVFEACRVHPSQAIVIDDLPVCLDWAEEVGAKVVQACASPHAQEPEFPIVLTKMADLPSLIRHLARM